MFQIERGELSVPIHEIEQAVQKFVEETDVKGDRQGFVTQTLNSIHAAVYQNSGDFWVLNLYGKLAGYVLGRVVVDVDNQLTYWLNQAWVAPEWRGHPVVKGAWQKVRKKAQDYFCRHIVVVSGRKSAPYCRFLGKGWREYVTLLKEDL